MAKKAKNGKNPAAVELGRLGGMARSQRKTVACRLNGRRGGRPRKKGEEGQPSS